MPLRYDESKRHEPRDGELCQTQEEEPDDDDAMIAMISISQRPLILLRPGVISQERKGRGPHGLQVLISPYVQRIAWRYVHRIGNPAGTLLTNITLG